MMKNWYMFMLAVVMVGTLGCGSRDTTVVEAPVENVETTIPGLDPKSADYQNAMSAGQ